MGTEFVKKVSYPTSAQKKQDKATDIYLAERIIDLPGQLSIGIGLTMSFDLVQLKIYTPKYNGNIEGGPSIN